MDATGEAEPRHYIVQKVREALAHDDRTNELDLIVSVNGDKVFITGTVPTPERRDSIGVVARETLPKHDVHNHVTVYETAEPTEGEELS
ncbi:MAG TPA: BON domain-containing protein [Actinomycetota bacterium]|nr:BON domain-containing protein [Actinomycetota bacterium]